jgi:uncharacterized lipoprotein YajG
MNKLSVLIVVFSVLFFAGCNEQKAKNKTTENKSLLSDREQIPGVDGTSLSVDKSLNMKPVANSGVAGISKPGEQSEW